MGKQVQPKAMQTPSFTTQNATMFVGNKPIFSKVQIKKESNGLIWVPLEETVKGLGLDVHLTNGGYTVGHTDGLFHVKMNQTKAMAADHSVMLPQKPKFFDQKPYVTTRALSILLGGPVKWNGARSQIVISPNNDGFRALRNKSVAGGTMKGLAVVNANDIINYGHNFMGTPYQFASGPYDRTHTFDCSSFVQYVYGHFGINLPRSSISQSQAGQLIPSNQMQPGDLLFFSTPGRYASNQIVGHVGIYVGNNQVLHTFGSPGVTITNLNANWSKRILFAKRII